MLPNSLPLAGATLALTLLMSEAHSAKWIKVDQPDTNPPITKTITWEQAKPSDEIDAFGWEPVEIDYQFCADGRTIDHLTAQLSLEKPCMPIDYGVIVYPHSVQDIEDLR